MKKIFRSAIMLITVAALSAALCSCGSSPSDNGMTRIRIAYFPNITHTQALVMKNQGILEELWADKCKVSWTSFNAGPAEVEAIFAGEIDLGYIGPVPALNANVKSGGEVKIIANCTNAGAILLKRTDAGIETINDLSGKKVAVPQIGNTQHLCLLNILNENGLSGKVTINASSNADILNLIGNGSVDAALVPEPWGTTIENMGNAELLLDEKEVFLGGNYPTAVVIASKDFMDAHPELVKDFLNAHKEATLFINNHMDSAQEIVNTEIHSVTGKSLDADVIQGAFSRMVVSTELNHEAILKFAEISKAENIIDTIPEESNVFATEFSQ